jgi:hypothetical protein
MTAADRASGPIDIATTTETAIVLTFRNEDQRGDIVIDWPPRLGPTADLDVIGLRGDDRSLVVATATAAGTDLYRVADPVGRSAGGRLRVPDPRLLAHLEGRSLRFDVSPDLGWAIVTDRVETIRLVRLADGRTWAADRDRGYVWAGGR